MPLIIGQTGVRQLPAELVDNAAFVKEIDFDPVHQTAEPAQPAEKISGRADRFDTLSISAEGLAKIKELRGSPSAQPAPVDITDPAAVEHRQQGEAMAREALIKSGAHSRARVNLRLTLQIISSGGTD